MGDRGFSSKCEPLFLFFFVFFLMIPPADANSMRIASAHDKKTEREKVQIGPIAMSELIILALPFSADSDDGDDENIRQPSENVEWSGEDSDDAVPSKRNEDKEVRLGNS